MTKNNKFLRYIIPSLSFIFILFLWYHMHMHRLGDVPFEMHIDEFGIGYDAYSLLNYHVDRWLMKFPVYLNNYDSGSSIGYTILCCLSILLWGNTSTFALRFPAAIMSLLSMFLVAKITEKIQHKWFPFIAMIFFNILPYYTMQSRVALDCNLMMCAMLGIIFFMYKTLESDKDYLWLILGIITGISLYTYILSWIVIPIVVFLYLIYAFLLHRLNLKRIFLFGIPLVILAAPLICCAIINVFDLETIYLPFCTIPKIFNSRLGEFKFQNIFSTLKRFYTVIFYGDGLPVNAIYKYFTMYRLSIPFVISGMIISFISTIKSIKKKELNILYFANSVFIAELILTFMLGYDVVNINRINGIFASLFIYLMVSLIYIWKLSACLFKKFFPNRKSYWSLTPIALIFSLYLMLFIDWNHYYFTDRTLAKMHFASQLDEIISVFGDDIYTKNVHLDANYAQFLLATHMSPYEFNAPSLERNESEIESWRNITFNLWGEFGVVDDNAIYVVYREHKEFIEYFRSFDLNTCETLHFICFYN